MSRGPRVRVEARAKLNLGLAVGPRRDDGFHELVTVFQSVSLADTLWIEPRARGFSLSVRHEDASLRPSGARRPRGRRRFASRGIPAGRDNLVIRAARRLSDAAGLEGGAHFTLVKRIPARAGLGGGSADAAAALVGLARLERLRLTRTRRLELAAELGSDVPFAASGGTALGRGRGERLVPLRLARGFRALVAMPEWEVSTAQAYRAIDRGKYGLTAWGAKLRFGQSLGRERLTAERALRLGNTFESALGNRQSDFHSLCERLRAVGVPRPRLTGSGSAVFGILDPGRTVKSILAGFVGRERLFVVRSRRTSLRVGVDTVT